MWKVFRNTGNKENEKFEPNDLLFFIHQMGKGKEERKEEELGTGSMGKKGGGGQEEGEKKN